MEKMKGGVILPDLRIYSPSVVIFFPACEEDTVSRRPRLGPLLLLFSIDVPEISLKELQRGFDRNGSSIVGKDNNRN